MRTCATVGDDLPPIQSRELIEKKLTKTYSLLDPGLFDEGKIISKWRLILNVAPDEIKNAVRT